MFELSQGACRLAKGLGPAPVGSCATACAALWQWWKSVAYEELVFCIAFEHHVAHHVYLRRGTLILDPSGHQFGTHRGHVYEAKDKKALADHHRNTIETSCMREFQALLRAVGWPEHQWPTGTKVQGAMKTLQALHCGEPTLPAPGAD